MLALDPAIKKQHCLELVGSLSEEGQYFDNILIEILVEVTKEFQIEEGVTNLIRPIVEEILNLPLSDSNLLNAL
jgi:hypothetical protein